MEYTAMFRTVLVVCCVGVSTSQLTSLLNPQQGTQNSASDLLQQTLLQNMRSQASLLNNMGMSRTSNPALDMLLSGLNSQRQPPASSSSNTMWSNMVPVDQLLEQQRNIHASLVHNLLDTASNTQDQQQPNVDNTVRGTSAAPAPIDSMRVILFNRPARKIGSNFDTGPIPTSQSGFSSSFTSGPTSSHFFENVVSGFSTGSTSGFDSNQGREKGSQSRSNIRSRSQRDFSNEPTVTDSSGQQQGTSRTNQAPTTPVRGQSPALTCTEEFRQIPRHTLCMDDNPAVTYSGVSIDDTLLITQLHNELRAGVQPPAADLLKLHWDDRLAAVAEKWAKQCRLAHDKERSIPELGLSVGQNVAVGYDNWQTAIQQWYDEIRMYRYGYEPDSYLGTNGWSKIAHFTQIVQNGTYLIGCGYAECPNTEYIRFYVCNYAAGQSDLAYPYTAGTRCGSCPNNCVNGLCDCGNLVCRNKGKLDPGTCTCECPRPYKGKACEIVDCPTEDNWICGRDWPQSYCDRYFNVPEECPHMCGLCGGAPVNKPHPEKPVIPNTTFTSSFGCKYTGKRDSQQKCKKYGDKGADMRMCASEGGSVGCSECDRYFNIKKDYCPVMCGLCDPPCNGKKCLNGGTLDTGRCTCTCRPPFSGDICQLAQCPVNGDPRFCNYWPRRYCDMYHNVPEECPYKCGICTDTTNPLTTA